MISEQIVLKGNEALLPEKERAVLLAMRIVAQRPDPLNEKQILARQLLMATDSETFKSISEWQRAH